MQNNLAGSLEEAKRMAESMLGTSSKVSKPYQENNEHFMIKGFKKSDSEIMGNEKEEEPEPAPVVPEEPVHHHQEVEEKPPQMLTLDNPTSYEKEPEPASTGGSTLSLNNTVMTQERPKEEPKEGVLAMGMPNTAAITNSENLDPVTSAPLDIEPEKTEAQIPAADPADFNPEIMQQVREQAEIADRPPEPLPSMNPLKIAERPMTNLTPSDMTPEEYAAKRMGGGASLNDMAVKEEQHKVISETIEQVPFEHVHPAQEIPEPTDGSLDAEPHLQEVQFEHPQPAPEPVAHPEPIPQNVPEAAPQPAPQPQFAPQEQFAQPEPFPQPVPQEIPQQMAPPEPVVQQQVAPQPVAQAAPQPMVQEPHVEHTQQVPTQFNTEEKNEFGTPKREKVELSAEDKKLRDDVDLSKVFNTGAK